MCLVFRHILQDLKRLQMKKTILILAANPIDTNQLRLDKEVREIENSS